jgi:hypothetical protein
MEKCKLICSCTHLAVKATLPKGAMSWFKDAQGYSRCVGCAKLRHPTDLDAVRVNAKGPEFKKVNLTYKKMYAPQYLYDDTVPKKIKKPLTEHILLGSLVKSYEQINGPHEGGFLKAEWNDKEGSIEAEIDF